ncbi:MAG: M15 family metallopeptidase [Ilumatobacteraceae bacterium]
MPSPRPHLSRPRPRAMALVVTAVVASSAVVAVAAPGLIGTIDGPATPGARAQAVEVLGDIVTVSDVGELDTANLLDAVAAAREAGGAGTAGRGATIGMIRITRAGSTVQQAPAGFRLPLSVTALHPSAIAAVSGRAVSGALGPRAVVMGERTAGLRGAQAGDLIDLVAADGGVHTLTISKIATEEEVGGNELLMTIEAADRLGIATDTQVVIWGFSSRSSIEAALAERGVVGRFRTRIRHSWDPQSPDGTHGLARTKELLGEFAYQVHGDGSVTQEAAWQAANLPAGRVVLSSQIPIRARCHNRIVGDLQAALADVAEAGLAGAIDVANANAYGGCHYPRFNRIAGELGFLSRHSWGMALDTNTVSNCQGCVPQMNCDVVRIFRRHNFAWGGNFLVSDGMHFEWVGERRDQLSYPSTYCPNLVDATPERSAEGSAEATPAGDSRAVLFVTDEPAMVHDH